MIIKIIYLTALSLTIFYPYCFLLNLNEPLKQKFHHFHIGLPIVIGGVLCFFIMNEGFSQISKLFYCIWLLILIIIGIYSWNKEYLEARLTFTVNAIGLVVYAALLDQLLGFRFSIYIVCVVSALIYCASFYAMNLGHWYLNVHGLAIKHLKNAIYCLWVLLFMRLIWDVCFLFISKVVYLGESVRLIDFMFQLDGFLLWVALFFGTIFPFVIMFFVREILKLKNTQATTGVLYVILCAVLLGDIAYKYYLIKFGIAL